jgi:hypothetical protein
VKVEGARKGVEAIKEARARRWRKVVETKRRRIVEASDCGCGCIGPCRAVTCVKCLEPRADGAYVILGVVVTFMVIGQYCRWSPRRFLYSHRPCMQGLWRILLDSRVRAVFCLWEESELMPTVEADAQPVLGVDAKTLEKLSIMAAFPGTYTLSNASYRNRRFLPSLESARRTAIMVHDVEDELWK